MNATQHPSEEDLIAFQLGEPTQTPGLAEHLEHCPDCARLAESIAHTLRVFSAAPVPQANLDHAWQRLRGSLPALAAIKPKPRQSAWWKWLSAPVLAALLGVGYLAAKPHARQPVPVNDAANHLPAGPLSDQPRDPDLAAHLASAERLLTEISHSNGPLDQSTRTQAQALLLTNAVYVRKATADGDTADASVLEDLGRTLTTLEHEPQAATEQDKGWHLKLQMNTDGLLLDIRILQQNDSKPTTKDPQ